MESPKEDGAHRADAARGAAEETAGEGSPTVEGRQLRGRPLLRLAFYGTILALALLRISLNPPIHLPIVLILVTWYITAGLYFGLRPRELVPGCLTLGLRLVFFVYEVSAVVVLTHHLGGSGWLAVLLLVYPVTEINVLSPGRAGAAASVIAIVACTAMAVIEAIGWLPHDPFYSVSDPLYRQPEYLLAVLIVASFTLIAPAIAQGRSRS